jgi:hypothetical protein
MFYHPPLHFHTLRHLLLPNTNLQVSDTPSPRPSPRLPPTLPSSSTLPRTPTTSLPTSPRSTVSRSRRGNVMLETLKRSSLPSRRLTRPLVLFTVLSPTLVFPLSRMLWTWKSLTTQKSVSHLSQSFRLSSITRNSDEDCDLWEERSNGGKRDIFLAFFSQPIPFTPTPILRSSFPPHHVSPSFLPRLSADQQTTSTSGVNLPVPRPLPTSGPSLATRRDPSS